MILTSRKVTLSESLGTRSRSGFRSGSRSYSRACSRAGSRARSRSMSSWSWSKSWVRYDSRSISSKRYSRGKK